MIKKSLLILTAAVGLTMTAKAQLGCTLDECEQRYGPGKPFLSERSYTFLLQPNLLKNFSGGPILYYGYFYAGEGF
jgi:hypothetical protein